MVFDGRTYSVLVVSSSEKFELAMKQLLGERGYDPVCYAGSVASAKRMLLEQSFDFVIINSPLPDDTGIKIAIDVSTDKNSVCLLLVRADIYDDINEKVVDHGVFTLPKPTSSVIITQGLQWLAAARERLRRLEKKTLSIEEKMEEIRFVNRAKWALIQNLNMSEAEAHRYIEKRAMDGCITRREVAESILKTYN